MLRTSASRTWIKANGTAHSERARRDPSKPSCQRGSWPTLVAPQKSRARGQKSRERRDDPALSLLTWPASQPAQAVSIGCFLWR